MRIESYGIEDRGRKDSAPKESFSWDLVILYVLSARYKAL